MDYTNGLTEMEAQEVAYEIIAKFERHAADQEDLDAALSWLPDFLWRVSRRDDSDFERLAARRGGECSKCGKWVCPPLTCYGCHALPPKIEAVINAAKRWKRAYARTDGSYSTNKGEAGEARQELSDALAELEK